MSQIEKAKRRLRGLPKDFTYTEAKSLLMYLNFVEHNKGKTSGSRVKFYRESDKLAFILHKPHPGDVMREYAIKDLYTFLVENGEL